MRITLVSNLDPADTRPPAGLLRFAIEAFERQGASIELLKPNRHERRPWMRLKEIFYPRLLGQKYTRSRDVALLREWGHRLAQGLGGSNSRVVLSLVHLGSQPVAYLDCRQPIVIWTDCVFEDAVELYPGLRNLCPESRRNGRLNEAAAVERARLVIYTSEWAARSARRKYPQQRDRIKVVCYGANLPASDQSRESIARLIEARGARTLKLVFLGSRWSDKGGDIVLEAASILDRQGHPLQLKIVGSDPPLPLPSFVSCAGFVDKNSEEGYRRFRSILEESHLLILPTRADCTPHVLSEAFAFGVPCVTSDVGGIGTIVEDGKSGKVLPLSSTAEDYARTLLDLFLDSASYRRMALAAFDESRSRLNWDSATSQVLALMHEVVQEASGPA